MMSDLRVGDKLARPDEPKSYFEILDSRIHAGTIHVFDSGKREARYMDETLVRAAISEGSLVLQRTGMPRVGIAAQNDNQALHARVRLLQLAMRRIEAIQAEFDLSFAAAIPRALEQCKKENANDTLAIGFPSRATLFRARKKQSLGLPILNGDKNKGNRTPRYSRELVDFVQGVIEERFLITESRWTVLDLTNYINRELRRRQLVLGKHDISRKFVLTVIRGLSADSEYDRMNPLDRIAGKSFAKRRIRAALPFTRVEQDALHLPFVVKTEHGVARSVYLVLAIDVCTGYPVGWHITVGAPREMDSLRCLEMYLTPSKGARFKELGIASAPNIYGTPTQVIFDNGPETKGSRIMRLEILGMDVKHCKAKEAQGKPFIERLNKSLKEALQLLPGCTRFNGKDGKRDPVALGDELMNVEALEKWIVRWLYESWANTPLERLRWDELLVTKVKGKTPVDRLRYLTEEMGHPITLPPARHEWIAALFDHRTCKLSAKSGVTLEHGFRYKSDAIAYLLNKYGDRAELHVVYNPDDFRQVYVYESDELPLITLTHEHIRPDTPAWTFAEAKAHLDAGMKDWVIPSEKEQFLSDLDKAVTSTPSKSSRKGRAPGKREENKTTVTLSRVREAKTRALERPLANTGPFKPSLAATDLLPGPISYEEIPEMPIVNRNTGEKLL